MFSCRRYLHYTTQTQLVMYPTPSGYYSTCIGLIFKLHTLSYIGPQHAPVRCNVKAKRTAVWSERYTNRHLIEITLQTLPNRLFVLKHTYHGERSVTVTRIMGGKPMQHRTGKTTRSIASAGLWFTGTQHRSQSSKLGTTRKKYR